MDLEGAVVMGRECLEEWCSNRVSPRKNWHTMAGDRALEADESHHRCDLCYAGWLVRKEVRLTTARKAYRCEGCKKAIRKGEKYRLGLRTAFVYARYAERVQVCDGCRKRWLSKGDAG